MSFARQNGGLYGYGIVSGGAIGGLSGGARKAKVYTQEELMMLKQARNRAAKLRRQAVKAEKALLGESYVHKARAPKVVRTAEEQREHVNRLARERRARKKAQNAVLTELSIPGASGYGLVGNGAQSYYGGRRRM